MELRQYQIDDLARIRGAFKDHRRVLYVLPTGGGKTEMFVHIAVAHTRKNPNALVYILVHRAELMEQVADTVVSQGGGCGWIAQNRSPGAGDRIVVASVQTLVRRLGQFRAPTFLVTDEAHHSTASTAWGKVAAHYRGTPNLGVTATPRRLSGEGLGESFDAIVVGPTVRDLIRLGYLARPDVYCPAVPDLRGVHNRGGEYISAELERILEQSTITGDAIEAYKKHAPGKKFVCFGVSRSHIEKVAAAFCAADIPVRAIDGSCSREERASIVGLFKSGGSDGQIRGLISCQLIDEGFNVPGIECGIDLAPTRSLSRYLQRVGRCLRVADGKDSAVILDLAGNALRHGLPQADQSWSLEGSATARSAGAERPPSVRICDQCFAASASLSDACAQCGHVFPVNGRTFATQKGELTLLKEAKAEEIAAARAAAEKAREEQKGTYGYENLVAFAKAKRYKNPERWAWIIHNARLKKRQKLRAKI